MLGPLLFNIFINEVFYFIQDAYICKFADDNYIQLRIILRKLKLP